jgi:aminopeptidase N
MYQYLLIVSTLICTLLSQSSLAQIGRASDSIKVYDKVKFNTVLVQQTDNERYKDFLKSNGDSFSLIQRTESENFIKSHNIQIQLQPSSHILQGSDRIKFLKSITNPFKLRILSSLEILSVTFSSKNVDFTVKKDSLYQEIEIVPPPTGISEVNISYKGNVYNMPNQRLLTQKHANSPGIISDAKGEGIYLPGGSYYPQSDRELADFNVEVTLPDSLTIITSGKLSIDKKENGIRTMSYQTEQAIDDLILVGGKYFVIDSIFDNKRFAVCMFEKNPVAASYLKATIDYYKYYVTLFGPYPYSSFTTVENFFATGFGMPGYTLLSNKLMAMPWIVLSPGSLAHEFVHNWWGNSVFVDYEGGNWCEALTTFSTNYYYNVITKQKDAMINWRKNALLSLESLPEKNNYPVIKFKSQVTSDDAIIGYQKGGFIFYELIKVMGDIHFFGGLKEFAKEFKGKRAYWYDLEQIFERYSKNAKLDIPVAKIFYQWLGETYLPKISLDSVKIADGKASFIIRQDTNYFTMVPVKIVTANDTAWNYCNISKNVNGFFSKIKGNVASVTLDPEYSVLRQLYPWEIPYSFSQTLKNNPIIILPSKDAKDYDVFSKFAEMLKQSDYIFDSKSVDELTDKDWVDRPVVILGDKNSNKYYSNISNNLPLDIAISDTSVRINKNSYPLKGNIILLSMSHPKAPSKTLSFMYCSNLESAEQFRRVFYYFGTSLNIINQSRPGKPLIQMELFPINYNKSAMQWINN